MRLMERAATRANLPLHYSQGFNPHPRFSLLLPRPVGVASQAELLVLDLDDEPAVTPEDLAAALAKQLPPGISVLRAESLATGSMPQVGQADYRIAIAPGQEPALRTRLAELESAARWDVSARRPRDEPGSTPAPVDIRPRVRRLEIRDGGLEFTLAGDAGGPGRPDHVLILVGYQYFLEQSSLARASESPTPVLAGLVRTRLELSHGVRPPREAQNRPDPAAMPGETPV